MTETRTAREKMLAGELYLGPDPELGALSDAARVRLKVFNETPRTDFAARQAALAALTGKPTASAWVESQFLVDYGVHLDLGDCYVNMNCTFLDSNRITIGDYAFIGPNVQLITATHPLDIADRIIPYPDDPAMPSRVVGRALPITIEEYCWIGAGVIVMPGVTIGRGTTVGAGSVVTKSLPPWCLALGSPARVVRQLEPRPPQLLTPAGKA